MATFMTRREHPVRNRNHHPAARRHRRRGLFLERLEVRSLMAGFNFTDFSDASGLSLIGNASISADNRLRLTPASFNQQGAAWYSLDKPMVGRGV